MTQCEIYDVVDDNVRFFADDGAALKARVDPPGRFLGLTILAATYDLQESMLSGEPHLRTYLPKVRYLEKGPFKNVGEVEAHLDRASRASSG